MISGCSEGQLILWNINQFEKGGFDSSHSGKVNSIAINQHGQFAVWSTYDGIITYKNLTDNATIDIYKGRFYGNKVAINNTGDSVLACFNNNRVLLWNIAQEITTIELRGHRSAVTCIDFCYDQLYAVSGSDDHTVKIWDLEKGIEVRTLQGHSCAITSVGTLFNRHMIASADKSGIIIFWDYKSGQELFRIKTFYNRDKFTDSARFLYDPQWRHSPENVHPPAIDQMKITHDNQYLVFSQRDSPIRIWNLQKNAIHQELIGHTDLVRGLALSDDGLLVFSASLDNTLKTWEISTGKCLCTFTFDNSLLCCAVGNNGGIVMTGQNAVNSKVQLLELIAPASH